MKEEYPTVAEFKEKHPDARACPVCGYKYYVWIGGVVRVALAYEDGHCLVCEVKERDR